ncbi:MAG: hypothetical protein R3C05_23250 [Pirellulaceae bacterium]
MPTSSSRTRITRLLRPNRVKGLGIDIGTSGIKIAEVSQGRHGLRWLSRAYHPFEQPWNDEGLDAAELSSRLLDQLPRTVDGVPRDATVSLPASLCVARIVRRQDAKTVGTQMHNELGPDAQWCAWQVPGKQPEEEHLVAYGLRSDFAQAVGHTLERCGYRCVRIDAQPFALYRLRNLDAISQPAVDGVIDWGWRSCVMMLGTDRGPGLMRELPRCGLRELVENAADRMNCTVEAILGVLRRSEEVKSATDSGRRTSDQARDILGPWIRRVAHEIDQTLRFTKRIGCVGSTRSLLLGGGVGSLPNVSTMLSSETTLNVRRWCWLGEKRFRSSAWSPPDAIHANAFSLAATDLIEPPVASDVAERSAVVAH